MNGAGHVLDDRGTGAAAASSSAMVRPGYGHASVADLLPGVAAHLGVPGFRDAVGLPATGRYLLVLVDGLGWHLLRESAAVAPHLGGLLGSSAALTACVPSTTATSLASLGTGLPPGQHGVVSYVSRVPTTGALLNALSWGADPDPRTYQPQPTIFEQIVGAGLVARSVSPRHFAGSGLTAATQRGAEFIGYSDDDSDEERVELIMQAATRSPRSLVYAYERDVDHAGHGDGAGSPRWQRALARVDRRCQMLAERLPRDVTMIVTADHGMINGESAHRIVLEDEPDLMAGVDAVGGEPRFRQLYVDRDDPELVAGRWADRLGDRAWVRTRERGIAEGWFGPVTEQAINRYGHVLVAMRDDWALLTRTQRREMSLLGMHGSLTPAEMLVPLLIC